MRSRGLVSEDGVCSRNGKNCTLRPCEQLRRIVTLMTVPMMGVMEVEVRVGHRHMPVTVAVFATWGFI